MSAGDHVGAALSPGKEPSATTERKPGWKLQPLWTWW